MKLITTSWDDGHIMDFRIAELLEKYGLSGTFYIPLRNKEHEVMSENKLLELSAKFEIGGHTIGHTRINNKSKELFDYEIKGCYDWLNNLLGKAPKAFCFPGGVYNSAAIDFTLNTGFEVIRTTELLNPWMDANKVVIPTTLQVYPHSRFTYIKHLIKRVKVESLLFYLKSNKSSDLRKMLEYYIEYIQLNGGCFHLWGHSWEIEEYNLWETLEDLLKMLSGIPGMDYVNNGELLKYKLQH